MATNTSLLEEMLENLVNENKEQANDLFHEYVVSKSREIYEAMMDQSQFEAADDEDDFGAEEDDFGGDATDDLENELDDNTDEFDDEEQSQDALFQDLDSIVDELQAKFDELKGLSGNDQDADEDDFGAEEPADDSFGDEEDITDSFEPEMSTVREYVEKVGTDWGKSPKMGDNGSNAKSVVAGKNDMGGSSANILKGGTSTTGGTQGGLVNPKAQDIKSGNVNVPGGKAGNAFTKKEPGHGAEKKSTGDNGANPNSLFRGKR